MPRYIVIVGSIMSGLGKGVVTASISKLISSLGYKVLPIKFDGYLNVDCGTMNPFRHGEVFVLEDGTECDMDFGTYERYLNISLKGDCSITGGKIFQKVITKERKGEYLGNDVQFVPHVTREIQEWIKNLAESEKADVVVIEVGGTVGDIENGYFLEAMRQLSLKEKTVFVQLTFVPEINGEQKTKPTQHANRLINSLGINPSIILCRSSKPLERDARQKISLFCNVDDEDIFDDYDLQTIYELPIVLQKQSFIERIAQKLDLRKTDANLDNWKKLVERIKNPVKTVNIAMVGKYTKIKDAYVSIFEAFNHVLAHTGIKTNLKMIESTDIEEGKIDVNTLKNFEGILVPGGFGKRGIEGKIKAIQFARENKIPYLGLCLGLQLMVVEYARNVCNLEDANSTEFDKDTKHPVICLLPEQRDIIYKGGTMRLGNYECLIKKDTIAYSAYQSEKIVERHRHRYEVNPEYVKLLEEKGLVISGTSFNNKIVEIVEWKNQFGIATQAHPELSSKLEKPNPLFMIFVKEAAKK
ncbi:MAG: CTP synthase (glutamine hydrolyzing) [Candidatus Micrarchaeota archaeon]|nr:CTP synthase (glutamine hydrolyzing) [Candidatus Micrarchaeota archaeon]